MGISRREQISNLELLPNGLECGSRPWAVFGNWMVVLRSRIYCMCVRTNFWLVWCNLSDWGICNHGTQGKKEYPGFLWFYSGFYVILLSLNRQVEKRLVSDWKTSVVGGRAYQWKNFRTLCLVSFIWNSLWTPLKVRGDYKNFSSSTKLF